MNNGTTPPEPDEIDWKILSMLQENCRTSLAKIGEHVGLSAPSVTERVHKLEASGAIRGYHAALDARSLGVDVTAFIGVSVSHPKKVEKFELAVEAIDDVLECHHVTGLHTLLVKAKTRSTSTLEALISKLRGLDGVERTETMVVLSTHTERFEVPLEAERQRAEEPEARRSRRHGAASRRRNGR